MAITELVFPIFKPETAQQALNTLRTESMTFGGTFGLLSRRVGHVQRLNDQVISASHRAILALEWNDTKDFRKFFPASEVFGAFRNKMIPYLVQVPMPQPFQPAPGYSRSSELFESGVTQVFVANVGNGNQEIENAWQKFVERLRQENRGVKNWAGWGLEDAEDSWLGIVGYDSAEELHSVGGRENVAALVENIKKIEGMEEFIVTFE
ncbi:hypothetical protein BDV96DRAFT_685972 [Lophiotrema nucula]|uniref:ABM domain-containing protein n=1 Tax=Lophiotrema nucula TaxID=690887 RepID=A0A6A5ZDW5_9PLEO|nr:hypothetical protein BDV96DRAFT_685972 [Lophiotrema nucula]